MRSYLPSFLSRKADKEHWELQEPGADPSEGLLDPAGGASRPYRRQRSLASFLGRRKIWTICALIFISILTLWVWEQYPDAVGGSFGLHEDLSKYTGELPWGSAHNVDGREVFWWEQFPE